MISINTSSSIAYSYKITPKQRFYKGFNRFYKVLSNILFVIVACLLVTILFYSLYTKKYGTDGKAPYISAYVIISPSMVPSINVNDAVVAIKPQASKLDKNDIITFKSTDARYTGLTVTHRIMEKSKDGYHTKGDNNTTPDDTPVSFENIMGKVILVIPFLGYIRTFLTMPLGWILLIAVPCIFIILYDIFKLSKSMQKTKSFDDYRFRNVEILGDGGRYEKK